MSKLERVRKLLDDLSVEAIFLTSPSNVFYLSGFRSTNAFIILTERENIFLTDARYYERAKEFLKEWEVILLKTSLKYAVNRLLREKEIKLVAFEKDKVSLSLMENLKLKGSGIEWVGVDDMLKELRAQKEREELERIKEAVRKTDNIYKKIINGIKEGLRERDIRNRIIVEILNEGGEGESFPSIVAFGKGSAIPHWETSDRIIEGKGPLLIDMGIKYKGYCSDFTRTAYLGKAEGDFKNIYEIVKTAHLKAVEYVREGVKVGEIDRIAREYIERKGFGKYFIHSTGHGIGIDIHEYPRIYFKGKDSKDAVKEGMVFTIEPGIYIPDKFGVRLENIVVVYKDHAEPLSEVSLELMEL